MKICWNNLENLKYSRKTGKWKKDKSYYIYMNSCKICKEPYLTRSNYIGKFCSHHCSNKYIATKHGYENSITYKSWDSMKQRCLNPNHERYKDYGSKGIIICERWKNSFENFLEDMGERPEGTTIDRIDNSDGYYKENCRWATFKQQARNKSNNKLDEDKIREIKKLLKETNLTQKEIGNLFGVSLYTISKIKLGKIWRDIK
jgi:predicted XRE-type DNA-binding protein